MRDAGLNATEIGRAARSEQANRSRLAHGQSASSWGAQPKRLSSLRAGARRRTAHRGLRVPRWGYIWEMGVSQRHARGVFRFGSYSTSVPEIIERRPLRWQSSAGKSERHAGRRPKIASRCTRTGGAGRACFRSTAQARSTTDGSDSPTGSSTRRSLAGAAPSRTNPLRRMPLSERRPSNWSGRDIRVRNHSADIRSIFCAACDRLDLRWAA